MSTSIHDTLQQSLRDASLSMYLREVAAQDPVLNEHGITLATEADVYEYLLIDPLVEPAVQTSRGALAVGSLQQYVNAIIMGLEPGYDAKLSDGDVEEWRDKHRQYPLWAANMMLESYPEAYIDPTLRLGKSGYFRDLEQTINQARINTDTVGDAVLDYLSRFEEVANLKIINGYIANHEMAEGRWYFVGKPRTELTRYYWRSVDMTLHADGIQELAPGAWSDWEPVDFPVVEGAIIEESSIRPVYFNNRLYIVWAEKNLLVDDTRIEVTVPGSAGEPGSTESAGKPPRTELLLKMIYRRYDGTWSTPYTYERMEIAENPRDTLQTIAIYDVSMAPYRLIIGMYYGFRKIRESDLGIGNACAFMRNVQIDQNFNIKRLFPTARDDMEAEDDDKDMGTTEKYIRAVYHFLLVKSGKIDDLARKVLVAETALITSRGMQYSHAAIREDFGAHFPGVLDEFEIAADNATGTSVMLSASVVLAAFDWYPGTEQVIEVTAEIADTFRLSGKLKRIRNQWGLSPLTFVSGGISFGRKFWEIETKLPFSPFLAGSGLALGLIPVIISPYINIDYLNLAGAHIIQDVKEEDLLSGDALFYFEREDGTFFPSTITARPVENEGSAGYVELVIRNDTSGVWVVARAQNGASEVGTGSTRFTLKIGDEGEAVESMYTITLTAYQTFGVALGSASRRLTVIPGEADIEVPEGSNKGIPPYLAQRDTPQVGTAEYLDFTGSEMETFDDELRHPIRMNTLFANALINKANQGLEHLLRWSVQQIPEPPMADQEGTVTMDFHGANGLYFWELFFHLPFLASYRLNREQSHADAERWLRFVFDNTDKTGDPEQGKPPYWNVVPLVADEIVAGRVADLVLAASDPDVVAAAYPVHYRKAIFLHFIRNIVDRGDLAYRQQTPDSITEAKQWYMHAADLLGPAPEKGQVSQWTPRTLGELAGAKHAVLRAFEREACTGLLRIPLNARPIRAPREPNPHFRLPLNEVLTETWHTVATRLYNLRNSLTLDGKPMSLPLVASPLDPKALQASRVQAGGAGALASMAQVPWPHYRFQVIQERAHRGADVLIQFGNAILGLLERKDRVAQEHLQQAQLWEMSDFILTGHRHNSEMLEQGRVALEHTRDTVEVRRTHYQALYEENVSPGEETVMTLETQAKAVALSAGVAYGVAWGVRMLPNEAGAGAGFIGGVANGVEIEAAGGGTDWGGIVHAIGVGLTAASQAREIAAYVLATTEGWRRRAQEWELQYRLAESEVEQIDEQLLAMDLQITAARHLEIQAKEEQTRQKAMLDFLTTRYTNEALYQWLLGQLSAVYFQAYDLVIGLGMSAEAAYQYETGDYAKRFIRPGGWNDTWRGMTVGENLKLDLLRMDSAYLAGRPRELEITRTVSLRALFGDETWEGVLDNLRGKSASAGSLAGRNGENGQVSFELTERLFDEDYPGMYLRRLTTLGVSIPAVLGAYQDVKAMLSQTASYVIVSPSAEAVASLLDPDKTPTDQVKLNLRPGQQIAISNGADDAGMFTLAFQDERYLPFEGTGAVSAWMLEFPRPESAPQAALLDSLTDIILHVRYTARYGGQAFRQEVIDLLAS